MYLAVSDWAAVVRIIEAANVLLERKLTWTERVLLRFVRFLYTYRLRGLVGVMPPEVTAEILTASEKIKGSMWGNITKLKVISGLDTLFSLG